MNEPGARPRSLGALEAFIASLPRLAIGIFPTPLVRLDRLSDELGIDLWLKRDELSGLALGGNKTRKLEFVLADARARGYRTVVTVGPLTSNHTMMTAAAARRCGFDVHCVIGSERPARAAGNLLLTEYLGATLHFAPMDFATPTVVEQERLQELCDRVVAATGGYWIPGGGTMPEAEPGYMEAVAEIARQRAGRWDFDHFVAAFGTGSTTTGLLLGIALAGLDVFVHAVAVSSRHAIEEVFRRPPPARLFLDSAAHFGFGFTAADVPAHEIVFGYGEAGYGVPTPDADAALRVVAGREGYFLDPVYTAKAFAGLLGRVREGSIPRGSRVLFLHTGGLSMTPAAEKRYAHPIDL